MSDVAILYRDNPSVADTRAGQLVQFVGLQSEFVDVGATAALIHSLRATVAGCECLLVSMECLAQLCASMQTNVGIETILGAGKSILIYGCLPTEPHNSMVRLLSSGMLKGVKRVESRPSEFRVKNDREFCRELAGISFFAAQKSLHCFEPAGLAAENLIISIDNDPFFVLANYECSRVSLLAHDHFVDLNRTVERDYNLTSSFPDMVPLIMFLRNAMDERLWHSERARACFVVDDPLLQERYGFLEYAQLFSRMLPHKFSLSIAFIPWNHDRSDPEIMRFFPSGSPRGSLCIHGCDHTAGEFAVNNVILLSKKARLALERMGQHRARYGVSFDEVMVFPQGLFSSEALEALKSSGYLAAVNSDPHPSTADSQLRLGDILDVAVMSFSDFPLFLRRYPKDIAEFALDLFLGRPAIVVEHHGYFRKGYGALEDFVEKLNALNDRLEWTNLGTICSEACLTRTDRHGDVHVRFYTSHFHLRNSDSRSHDYVLYKRHTPGYPMPVITIDGSKVEAEEKDGYIILRLSLDAGAAAHIQMPAAKDASPDQYGQSVADRTKTSTRRLLSEFRDNYVDTNPLLGGVLSHARKIRAWLN